MHECTQYGREASLFGSLPTSISMFYAVCYISWSEEAVCVFPWWNDHELLLLLPHSSPALIPAITRVKVSAIPFFLISDE